MRVAVIDMGTNSTRLLVADVTSPTGLREVERHSRVTRLGRGVDTEGHLCSEAIEATCAVISGYLEILASQEPARTVAIATSAVRDAENGDAFLAELRERFDLGARVIGGLEEAQLTFRGATAGRSLTDGTLVLDIGGGSTELVIGDGEQVSFRESLQLGVVRHSERFLSADPPAAEQLEALADAVGSQLADARTRYGGASPSLGIAVAGTPTSLAAIALSLDPYDPAQVEGHMLELADIQKQLARLSSMSLEQRRTVVGLHPDRAPTIVCGVVILIGAMRAFGLERIAVSEQDILWGAALGAATGAQAA